MVNIPDQDQNSPIQTSLPPLDLAISSSSQPDSQQQPVKNKNYWKIATIFLLVSFLGITLAYIAMNKSVTQSAVVQKTPTVQTTSSPSTSISGIVGADPTVNWKTYTDPKYGFSFRYPLEWSISKPYEGNEQQTQLPDFMNNTYCLNAQIKNTNNSSGLPLSFDVCVNENPQNWTLSQWLQKVSSNSGGGFTDLNKTTLIDGLKAEVARFNPNFEDTYVNYQFTKNLIYTFSLGGNGEGASNYPLTDPFVQRELSSYHTLLSTFQFINQVTPDKERLWKR